MGEVFLAIHTPTRREVALKVLHAHYARNPEFVGRFMREAQATVQLRHPNIVEIFDANVVDGNYYIAMENLSGGSLTAYMTTLKQAGQPMPVDEALSIIRQIAQALSYAHQRGFIHRDIKPSNILKAADGRWVLTDFGIVLANAATKLTRISSVMGTAEYMSPEQGMGLEVDGRSDVYSLGMVLYEMVAGRLPFQADSPVSYIYKHVHETPPPVSKFRQGIPAGVAAIVNKAVAKKPDQRYTSAQEFVTAIENLSKPQKKAAPAWAPIAAVAGVLAVIGVVGAMALAGGRTPAQPTPAAPASATPALAVIIPTAASSAVPPTAIILPTQPNATTPPATAKQTPTTPPQPTATLTTLPTAAPSTTPGATPTRKPTNTPGVVSAVGPSLLSPAPNFQINSPGSPNFSWSAVAGLGANDYYQFSIHHPKGVDVTCTKKTSALGRDYIPSLNGQGQALTWSVGVVRVASPIVDGSACAGQSIAAPREQRALYWWVGGQSSAPGAPPPPKPTKCVPGVNC